MRSRGERLFNPINAVLLGLMALACFIPFWLVITGSFTDEQTILLQGYQLWPQRWSLEAFRFVLSSPQVGRSYLMSVAQSSLGTLLSVILMAMMAYPLSSPRVRYRRQIAFFIFFTTLFSGGLLPWYIVTTQVFKLKDSLPSLFVPYLFDVWWILIMRNFFRNLPPEIFDAALIDGANDWQVLARIVLPISTPVLATVALFMGVRFWNDWFLGAILLTGVEMRPLAVMIMNIINSIRYLEMSQNVSGITINLPTNSVQMATVLVAMGPIILLYPFVQRYFIRGLTIGAVK